MVVVILGPELRSWPLRLHVIVTGMSPCDTVHSSWAYTPVLTTEDPKKNGLMTGGSKKKMYINELD